MKQELSESTLFGKESIGKIIWKLAPPVMLAQLIQALYNIVDSYFVGKFSGDGLTALSVVYPIQFIIIALGVGTGIGVNTYMARMYALREKEQADQAAGMGVLLAVGMWAIFSVLCLLFLRFYIQISASSATAVQYANTYGLIVCVGSLGTFLESNYTKVHQARGNMKLPMLAQIVGAVINIILDPLLIFGYGFFPRMEIAGAAVATVIGQVAAAAITGFSAYVKMPDRKKIGMYTKQIYHYGYPQILMQLLMTLYIVVLNIILAEYCDEAVTVLGLYYKMQTFFFIPLFSLQTCIVPVLSYNYTIHQYRRCHKLTMDTVLISCGFMLIGVFCFWFLPDKLIELFSHDPKTITIGCTAFRIIGASFIPAVFSLISPVFFQAIGKSVQSVVLALIRQIGCLIPFFWLLSRINYDYSWWAFPLAETITGTVGTILYIQILRKWIAYDRSLSSKA